MDLRFVDGLESVPAAAWNALVPGGNPFVRHEFLLAQERHGCVGEHFGWIPRHLLAFDGDRLAGAVPLYAKDNSYGEFVFDWSWAGFWERHGRRYYPKLVAASPYSPVTGPRLLVHPEAARDEVAAVLAGALVEECRRGGFSGVHVLFPPREENEALEGAGWLRRLGCQFHWFNRGWRDFDEMLADFTARRRKNIRRERRRVREAGVEFRVLESPGITAEDWHGFHHFYAATFHRKGGVPTLTPGFFEEINRTLPGGVVLIQALRAGRVIAAALCLRDGRALYGRHWGASEFIDGLHFETCYYQGLDYCLRHGLARFEPGAQGEHKVMRGFEPVATYSAHWLADAHLRPAVAEFTAREARAVADYMDALRADLPWRRTEPAAP